MESPIENYSFAEKGARPGLAVPELERWLALWNLSTAIDGLFECWSPSQTAANGAQIVSAALSADQLGIRVEQHEATDDFHRWVRVTIPGENGHRVYDLSYDRAGLPVSFLESAQPLHASYAEMQADDIPELNTEPSLTAMRGLTRRLEKSLLITVLTA